MSGMTPQITLEVLTGNEDPYVMISNLSGAEQKWVVEALTDRPLPQDSPAGPTKEIREDGEGRVRVVFATFTVAGMMHGFVAGSLIHRGLDETRVAPNPYVS